MMDNTTITLVLADDHAVARAGIRAILGTAPDIEIVGEAENGAEVQELVAKLRPHMLLLDLKMPGPPAAEIEKWVRTNYPDTVTLVLTAHDRDSYLTRMIDAGAAGLLDKSESGERLIGAIRRAAKGEFLFDSGQLDRARHWRLAAGEKWESLTNREREILRLLVQGFDNAHIANMLTITSKTVAYHVTNILEKLEVSSRQEAVAWVHKYLPDTLE
jgi:two-component system, NarL family, response regulator LiaR